MNTILILAAASLATVWLLVHLVLGGREIARPLRAAPDLEPVVRDTQYLCWHFTSLAIACIAGFNLWAVYTNTPAFAQAGFVLALGFSVVGIALVAAIKGRYTVLPQGWLFVPVAVLGGFGLWL